MFVRRRRISTKSGNPAGTSPLSNTLPANNKQNLETCQDLHHVMFARIHMSRTFNIGGNIDIEGSLVASFLQYNERNTL
jgi:hypothetical protein